MKLAIENARIIDTSQKLDEITNLYIEDAKVVALKNAPQDWQADKKLDATGLTLTPGFIDIGTTIANGASLQSESKAAYKGGFTTLAISPKSNFILDNKANVQSTLDSAENLINILPIAALTKDLSGKFLTDMGSLKELGCVGASNLRGKYEDLNVLSLALQYAKGMDLKVFFYSEDADLKASGVAHKGSMANMLGLTGISTSAEIVCLARDLILASENGASVHFGGISAEKSLQVLANGKNLSIDFTTDVHMANLIYTDANLENYDTNFHLTPPLREESDRVALLQAVNSGVIQVIASGHCPVEIASKNAPFAESKAGMSNLENMFSMGYELVKNKELNFTRYIDAITNAPAQVLGLKNRGNLKVGSYADFNLIDLESKWQPNLENWQSFGVNNPCLNKELPAKVVACFAGGELKYSQNIQF